MHYRIREEIVVDDDGRRHRGLIALKRRYTVKKKDKILDLTI